MSVVSTEKKIHSGNSMFQKSGYIASCIISEIGHFCSIVRKMCSLVREIHGNYKSFSVSYGNFEQRRRTEFIRKSFLKYKKKKHKVIKTSAAVVVGIGVSLRELYKLFPTYIYVYKTHWNASFPCFCYKSNRYEYIWPLFWYILILSAAGVL